MQLVHPEIEQYAEDHTTPESEMLKKVVEHSDEELEHIDMLSGKVVGQLLRMLITLSGARRILEIGTFTGYSALSMAEVLPKDGQLITCEYNQRYKAIAREAFSQSKHGHKITLKMGPALETIKTLEGSFDLVFIDADKINYPEYYRQTMHMLTAGGLIVIDNVFWEGAVLNPDDEKSKAIAELNDTISEDERVEQVMLTVRDGVTILRKK